MRMRTLFALLILGLAPAVGAAPLPAPVATALRSVADVCSSSGGTPQTEQAACGSRGSDAV
jgi:hypothetical protein